MESEQFAKRLTLREQEDLESKVSFPTRPGSGVGGKGIRLIANFFQVFCVFKC